LFDECANDFDGRCAMGSEEGQHRARLEARPRFALRRQLRVRTPVPICRTRDNSQLGLEEMPVIPDASIRVPRLEESAASVMTALKPRE
jgi:hypothetical protein